MPKTTLREAWANLCVTASGVELTRYARAYHIIRELISEYREPHLLTQPESVSLAKKILSRALQRNLTKGEVEAFLRG